MPTFEPNDMIKGFLSRWRIAFLLFLAGWMVIVSWDLGYSAIQWDESNHLNGGLSLLHGDLFGYLWFGSFYPPLHDLIIATFYAVAGSSVFTARLVSVFFGALTTFVVFEFSTRIYDKKVGFISGLLFAMIPGYIYVSRMAITETILSFFFTTTLVLFFFWMRTKNMILLWSSGLALGFGFMSQYRILAAPEYRILAAPVIIFLTLILVNKDPLKEKLGHLWNLSKSALTAAAPWLIFAIPIYTAGLVNKWLYAVQIGNPERLVYAAGIGRLPDWFTILPAYIQMPLYYFVELTVPWYDLHPISPYLYLLGLGGLIVLLYRRNDADKFLLTWFIGAYAFFTFLGNRQWRYMIPVFPVLATSASILIIGTFQKTLITLKSKNKTLKKKFLKAFAIFFIVTFSLFISYSLYIDFNDSKHMAQKDQIQIPIDQATNTLIDKINSTDSIMILCPNNQFSNDMIRFYLLKELKHNKVYQYPELPIDAYKPDFQTDKLIEECNQNNIKYLLLKEFQEKLPYFEPTLTSSMIYDILQNPVYMDKFSQIETVGEEPNRIFIIEFN